MICFSHSWEEKKKRNPTGYFKRGYQLWLSVQIACLGLEQAYREKVWHKDLIHKALVLFVERTDVKIVIKKGWLVQDLEDECNHFPFWFSKFSSFQAFYVMKFS